jgi:hypothetical protein
VLTKVPQINHFSKYYKYLLAREKGEISFLFTKNQEAMRTKTTQSNATLSMLFDAAKGILLACFLFTSFSYTYSQCKCLTSGGICEDGNCGNPRRNNCLTAGGNWLGNVPNCTAPLPVELREFKIENEQFIWVTASEMNNDFFIIEKSYDHENWVEVLKIHSEYNTSTTPTSYSATLPTLETGLVYFRLSQVDFDGSQKYFEAISVDFNTRNSQVISCYPNPSKDGIVAVKNVSKVNAFTIFSFDGKVLMSEHNLGNSLDISNFVDGVYTVRFDLKDGSTQTVKIIKKS